MNMSENDGWDIVGEYADTVASMATDISALRAQLDEAEKAADDFKHCAQRLADQLCEARAELANVRAENLVLQQTNALPEPELVNGVHFTAHNELTKYPSGKCELCGEQMPRGEEMFRFHGYSGPCPSLTVE